MSRGFGTYEDTESRQNMPKEDSTMMDENGCTENGSVAGDYQEAGRDPKLPRQSTEEIARKIKHLLEKPKGQKNIPEG